MSSANRPCDCPNPSSIGCMTCNASYLSDLIDKILSDIEETCENREPDIVEIPLGEFPWDLF